MTDQAFSDEDIWGAPSSPSPSSSTMSDEDVWGAAPVPKLIDGGKPYVPKPDQFTKSKRRINGKVYTEHGPTGAIYDPEHKITIDPEILKQFGQDEPTEQALKNYTIMNGGGDVVLQGRGAGMSTPQKEAEIKALSESLGHEGESAAQPTYSVELGKSFTKAAIHGVGDTMRGVSVLTTDDKRKVDEIEKGIANLPNMKGDEATKFFHSIPHYADINPIAAWNYQSAVQAWSNGDKEGMASSLATARKYTDTRPLDEQKLFKQGQEINAQVDGPDYNPAKGWEDSWTNMFGQGLGSSVAFLPVGVLSGGTGIAALGGAQSSAQQYDQGQGELKKVMDGEAPNSLLNKMTPEDAQRQVMRAAKLGALPGASEEAPIEFLLNGTVKTIPWLKPLANTPIFGKMLKTAGRVIMQAAAEGGQEYGQQVGSNFINQLMLNPDQKLTEGAWQNALAGALVGGAMQGGSEALDVAKSLKPAPGKGDLAPPDGAGPSATKPSGPSGPSGSQTAQNPSVAPANAAQEDDILRQAGLTDQIIADMNPTERQGAIQEAVKAGLTLKPATPVADKPSAEPISDIKAQIADMQDNSTVRTGVFLSKEAWAHAGKAIKGTPNAVKIENFDGKGGVLIAKSEKLGNLAIQARDAGVPMQQILGIMTGAGVGKPADGTKVVQQVTKDGNVTRETLVNTDAQPQTEKAFQAPDKTVRVVTPQEAIQRREEGVAADNSAVASPAAPITTSTETDMAPARERIDQNPTEKQIEAGNYRKGHVNVQGLDITVENPKGGTRSGVTPDGKPWSVEMPADYGYLKRSEGKDGDQVDVFIGPDHAAPNVYVIDQIDPATKKLDEHKSVIGASSPQMARQIYAKAFSDGSASKRFGGMKVMTVDEFKTWARDGKKTKPVADKVPVSTETAPSGGSEYRNFSPSELKVDAKRFQFKEGGDESGVTDRLKGVKKWDKFNAGTTIVWQSKDGTNYVADGHQRHGLATRLAAEGQDPKIHALVIREADGYSSDDARAYAALANIEQGTGSPIDAAKVIRARPDLATKLSPNGVLFKDGQGLAKLSEDAFGMVINKKVPANYAAIAGRLAPDPKTHLAILGQLAKSEPASAVEAESIVRDMLSAPQVEETMTDMFGSAQATQILFKERAQVLSAAVRAISQDKAAFKTLVKNETSFTDAGNKLAADKNQERANQDAKILAILQVEARRTGPIADALAVAAKQLHEGASTQAAVRGFIDAIQQQARPPRRNVEKASPAKPAAERKPQEPLASISDQTVSLNDGRTTEIREHVGDLEGLSETGSKAAGQRGGEVVPSGKGNKNDLTQKQTEELGADGKPQTVIPGAEKASQKTMAQRASDKPLKPNVEQQPLEHGLFGDSKDQGSLFSVNGNVTDTPAFRAWFGDSKVVDENGKPLVVYHGSRVPYLDRFDMSMEGSGAVNTQSKKLGGVWFTSSRDNAASFADPIDPHKASNDHMVYGDEGNYYAAIEDENGNSLFQVGPFKTHDEATSNADDAVRNYNANPQRGDAIVPTYLALKNPLELDGVIPREREFEQARKNGNDGIIARNVVDGTHPSDVYVAFSPAQIKSIHNRGTFDQNDPAILAAIAKPQATFYSALGRAVEAMKQEKAPASQWIGMIKNTPGIKPEEVAWLGLEDWLNAQQGSITKQQISDFIHENQVQVQDVVKGAASANADLTSPEFKDDIEHLKERDIETINNPFNDVPEVYFKVDGEPMTSEEMRDADVGTSSLQAALRISARFHGTSLSNKENTATKFHSYQVPGGENYRELLLTLPKNLNPEETVAQSMHDKYGSDWLKAMSDEDRKAYLNVATKDFTRVDNFKSSHFDEPNILAHVRFNDRVVPIDAPASIEDIGERIRKAVDAPSVKDLGNGAPIAALKKGIITEPEAAKFSAAKGYVNMPFKTHQKVLFLEEVQSDFGQHYRKAKQQVADYVDRNFDDLAAKMVKAGMIVKECD